MNIYLLEQGVNQNYDTYDSCVVVAESEEEARQCHPRGDKYNLSRKDWASDPSQVEVTLLGICTDKSYNSGAVLCSSFNAG